MFECKFDTDNAAFEGDNCEREVASILYDLRILINEGYKFGTIRDSNGNKVGEWVLTKPGKPTTMKRPPLPPEPDLLYIYNENCVMKGRLVPQRILDQYEEPEDGGDWSTYEATEETAKWMEENRGQFGRMVAKTIRDYLATA